MQSLLANSFLFHFDELSWTFLHHAAHHNSVDIIEFLFYEGEIVNSFDKSQRSPLHIAATALHIDAIKCLVRLGGNLQSRDHRNHSPLIVFLRTVLNTHYRKRRMTSTQILHTIQLLTYDYSSLWIPTEVNENHRRCMFLPGKEPQILTDDNTPKTYIPGTSPLSMAVRIPEKAIALAVIEMASCSYTPDCLLELQHAILSSIHVDETDVTMSLFKNFESVLRSHPTTNLDEMFANVNARTWPSDVRSSVLPAEFSCFLDLCLGIASQRAYHDVLLLLLQIATSSKRPPAKDNSFSSSPSKKELANSLSISDLTLWHTKIPSFVFASLLRDEVMTQLFMQSLPSYAGQVCSRSGYLVAVGCDLWPALSVTSSPDQMNPFLTFSPLAVTCILDDAQNLDVMLNAWKESEDTTTESALLDTEGLHPILGCLLGVSENCMNSLILRLGNKFVGKWIEAIKWSSPAPTCSILTLFMSVFKLKHEGRRSSVDKDQIIRVMSLLINFEPPVDFFFQHAATNEDSLQLKQLTSHIEGLRKRLLELYEQLLPESVWLNLVPSGAGLHSLIGTPSCKLSKSGMSSIPTYWEPDSLLTTEMKTVLELSRKEFLVRMRTWESIVERLTSPAFGPNIRLFVKHPSPERKWMTLARCVMTILDGIGGNDGPYKSADKSSSVTRKVSSEEWWGKLKNRAGSRTAPLKTIKMIADMKAFSLSFASSTGSRTTDGVRFIDRYTWDEVSRVFGRDGDGVARETILAMPDSRTSFVLRMLCDWVTAIISDGNIVYGDGDGKNKSDLASPSFSLLHFQIANLQIEECTLTKLKSHVFFSNNYRCKNWTPLQALVRGTGGSFSLDGELTQIMKSNEYLINGAIQIGLIPVNHAITEVLGSYVHKSIPLSVSEALAMHLISVSEEKLLLRRDPDGIPIILQLCRLEMWTAAASLIKRLARVLSCVSSDFGESGDGGSDSGLHQLSLPWPGGVEAFCTPKYQKIPEFVASSHRHIFLTTYEQAVDWSDGSTTSSPLAGEKVLIDSNWTSRLVSMVSPLDIAILKGNSDFVRLFLDSFPNLHIPLDTFLYGLKKEIPRVCLDFLVSSAIIDDSFDERRSYYSQLVTTNSASDHSPASQLQNITDTVIAKIMTSRRSGRWLDARQVHRELSKKLVQTAFDTAYKGIKQYESMAKYSVGGSHSKGFDVDVIQSGLFTGLCLDRQTGKVVLLDRTLVTVEEFRSDISYLYSALPPPLKTWGTLSTGYCSLHPLAQFGDTSFCEVALRLNARRYLCLDSQGTSPVYSALAQGDVKLAVLMLESCTTGKSHGKTSSEVGSEQLAKNLQTQILFPLQHCRNSPKVVGDLYGSLTGNVFVGHTVMQLPIFPDQLFLESATNQRMVACGAYMNGLNGVSVLETTLLNTLDKAQNLWMRICKSEKELFCLIKYLRTSNGSVLDSLHRVQKLFGLLRIPFIEVSLMWQRNIEQILHIGDFTRLTPTTLRSILSWETAVEIQSLLRDWLRQRADCSNFKYERSEEASRRSSRYHRAFLIPHDPPPIIWDDLLLWHCLDTDLKTVAECDAKYGTTKNPRTDHTGPFAHSMASHSVKHMLAASPASAVMFAVPRHIIDETKLVYKGAARHTLSAQRMIAFLEDWKTDGEGVLLALRLSYEILEFARNLSLARILVSLSHVPKQCWGKSGESRLRFEGNQNETELHPIDERLRQMKLADEYEESCRSQIEHIYDHSLSQRQLQVESKAAWNSPSISLSPSASDDRNDEPSRENKDRWIPVTGVMTRMRALDHVQPMDFMTFLSMPSEVSLRFANIRRVLFEGILYLLSALKFDSLCNWVCSIAKTHASGEDVYEYFKTDLKSSSAYSPNPPVADGGQEILITLQQLRVVDIVRIMEDQQIIQTTRIELDWARERLQRNNQDSITPMKCLIELGILIRSLKCSLSIYDDLPQSSGLRSPSIRGFDDNHEESHNSEGKLNLKSALRLQDKEVQDLRDLFVMEEEHTNPSKNLNFKSSIAKNIFGLPSSKNQSNFKKSQANRFRHTQLDARHPLSHNYRNPKIPDANHIPHDAGFDESTSSHIFENHIRDLQSAYEVAHAIISLLQDVYGVASVSQLYRTDPQLWLGRSFLNPLSELCIQCATFALPPEIASSSSSRSIFVPYRNVFETISLIEKPKLYLKETTEISSSVESCCEDLLNLGVHPVLPDSYGRSALVIAALSGLDCLFKRMLEYTTPDDLSKMGSALYETLVWHVLMQTPAINRYEDITHTNSIQTKPTIIDDSKLCSPTSHSQAYSKKKELRRRECYVRILVELLARGFPLGCPQESYWDCLDICAMKQLDGLLPLILDRYSNNGGNMKDSARLERNLAPSTGRAAYLKCLQMCTLGRNISKSNLLLLFGHILSASSATSGTRESLYSYLSLNHLIPKDIAHNDFLQHARYMSSAFAFQSFPLVDQNTNPIDALEKDFLYSTAFLVNKALKTFIPSVHLKKCPLRESITSAVTLIADSTYRSNRRNAALHSSEHLMEEWSIVHLVVGSGSTEKASLIFDFPDEILHKILTLSVRSVTPLLHLCCFYNVPGALLSLCRSARDWLSHSTPSGKHHMNSNSNIFDPNESVFFGPLNGNNTPIQVAVVYGFIGCVNVLLNIGVTVDMRYFVYCVSKGYGGDEVMTTIIHRLAARTEDTKSILLSLNKSTDDLILKGSPLLHLLIRRGWRRTIEVLMNLGLDVSVVDTRSTIPLNSLQTSIACGRKEITQLLSPYFREENMACSKISWTVRMHLADVWVSRMQRVQRYRKFVEIEAPSLFT